jgi:hypothetical protein
MPKTPDRFNNTRAVIAIENGRFFEEVQARTRELGCSVKKRIRPLAILARSDGRSARRSKVVLTTIVDRAVHLSATDAGSTVQNP